MLKNHETKYSIKFFFRIWYAFPLLWVIVLSVIVGMKEPNYLVFPFSLFYLIFGFIYFLLARKKIIVTDEFITVISGVRKYVIPNNRIMGWDYRIKEFQGGSPTYFVIKYADHKDKSKLVYINPTEYGKQNMESIIQLVKQRRS